MTFKIGQQVYCKNTFKGGLISKIDYINILDKSQSECMITFTCDETQKDITSNSNCLTTDYKLIIKFCKEQIEEYKEAFFREKKINEKFSTTYVYNNCSLSFS